VCVCVYIYIYIYIHVCGGEGVQCAPASKALCVDKIQVNISLLYS